MNRRRFLAALIAAPVAVEAAAEVAKKSSTLSVAEYRWSQGDTEFEGDWDELLRENMECLKQSFEENFDLRAYEASTFTADQLAYAGNAALEFYLKG